MVGKPKKTGSYAYVTVQLPFSDGQPVSVIFHAPEADRLKITASGKIIAFRWLLNKRDITHVVSPENGAEISLESIAQRIAQLVEKNSAHFEKTQKDAAAEARQMEEVQNKVTQAESWNIELTGNIDSEVGKLNDLEDKIAATRTALENQKRINAELQAKLDGLRKAKNPNIEELADSARNTATDKAGLQSQASSDKELLSNL